jgi:hypothetical protein
MPGLASGLSPSPRAVLASPLLDGDHPVNYNLFGREP